jgi:hypothetical protein
MLFEIHAEKNANDKKVFYYDNMSNKLSNDEGFVFEFPEIKDVIGQVEYKSFDKDHPLKKSNK